MSSSFTFRSSFKPFLNSFYKDRFSILLCPQYSRPSLEATLERLAEDAYQLEPLY